MSSRAFFGVSILGIALVGCGGETGPKTVPVTGLVQLNGKPLADATVTLIPTGKTPGIGGTARTDEAGKFKLVSARGGYGAPPGEYRVTVSRRVTADGSPVPPDVQPIEMKEPSHESLPAIYSSRERTRLTATVKPEGEPISLELTTSGG